MSTIGLGTSDDHSTPIANEFGINLDNANEMDEGEIDLENAEVHVPQTNATNNNSEQAEVIRERTSFQVGHYCGEMGQDFWVARRWQREFDTKQVASQILFVTIPA
ncbi:hypothetical protein V6N13_004883 [Hibiscus sabdariffa]